VRVTVVVVQLVGESQIGQPLARAAQAMYSPSPNRLAHQRQVAGRSDGNRYAALTAIQSGENQAYPSRNIA
jgi:hypothetical protein